MSNWPKRPDGTPMTMGEMTPAQRKEQATLACRKLESGFRRPEVQAALSEALSKERECKECFGFGYTIENDSEHGEIISGCRTCSIESQEKYSVPCVHGTIGSCIDCNPGTSLSVASKSVIDVNPRCRHDFLRDRL